MVKHQKMTNSLLHPNHLDDLHLEDESLSTPDLGGAAPITISQIGRDVHFPLIALHHHLHGLSPSFDDLVGGKGCGGSARIGGVEHSSVNQSSPARIVGMVIGQHKHHTGNHMLAI